MLRFRDLLKGWNFPPYIVGIVRGAIEAGVLAALAVLGTNMNEIASFLPELPSGIGTGEITTASLGLWLLRTLEAQADQIIDPMQNRTAEARAANPPQ
jgi:hypothetical protein